MRLILPGKVSLSQRQDLPISPAISTVQWFVWKWFMNTLQAYIQQRWTKGCKTEGSEDLSSNIINSEVGLEHQQVSNERCNCQQGTGSGRLKRSVAWNRGNTTPVYLLRRSNVHHFFGGTWIIKDSNLCPSSIARRACHVCHRLGGRQHISKLWEFLQATVLAHKRFGRHVIYDVRLER